MTMQRIPSIDPQAATGTAKTLLDGVQHKLGFVPNLMRTLAVSPAALDAYLSFNDRLSHGVLSPKLREQIALTVAYSDSCQYCLAAHTAIGGMLGLTPSQLEDAYTGDSSDPQIAAALQFAQQLVQNQGHVSDEEVDRVREAGFGDAEIAEIVAHVALNVFTNYFNTVAETEVDFPKTRKLVPAHSTTGW
jgi:uncharacterized peroxidase-related enzyme